MWDEDQIAMIRKIIIVALMLAGILCVLGWISGIAVHYYLAMD